MKSEIGGRNKSPACTFSPTSYSTFNSSDPYRIRTGDLCRDRAASTPDWTDGPFFECECRIDIHSFHTTQKSALRESNSPVQIGNLVPKPIGQEHKQNDSVFKFRISLQSVQWESNPHFRLGKAVGYRYIMDAKWLPNCQRSNSSQVVAFTTMSFSNFSRAPGGTRTHVLALRKRDLGR